MKKITLTELNLRNFQGARSVQVPLTGTTNIYGANATGKTTIFNAYMWLLFGKNSLDRTDFNVKTLDKNNEVIPDLEHEVEGVFEVDGVPVVLKRAMKEKHVKIRGTEDTRLEHDYTFFHNGTPVSASEYKKRVAELISEDVSKVITDPMYFNLRMKWQDRRAVLSQLAGEVSDTEVIPSLPVHQREILEQLLTSGKSLLDHKKEMSTKRSKIKEQKDLIPARIDEVKRSLPEPMDWNAIAGNIDRITGELAVIESQIESVAEAQRVRHEEIRTAESSRFGYEQQLTAERNRIRTEATAGIAEKRNELTQIEGAIARKTDQIRRNESDIAGYNTEIELKTKDNDGLRAEWATENEKTLEVDPSTFNCPACEQPLPSDRIEEKRAQLVANFNGDKKRKLSEIDARGMRNKGRISELQKLIDGLKWDNDKLQQEVDQEREKIPAIQKALSTDQPAPEPSDLENELVAKIAAVVIPEEAPADTSELKEKKSALNHEITQLKTEVGKRDQIEKGNTRIEELKEQEREYSQQIADIERSEMSIDAFNRSKIDLIESRINGKFQLVKFKMFEAQLNGGEVEICECMVDGVPFSDLNTAMKINAGIDVINALTDFYDVSAPIFIDGRESVTELIETPSQLVSLIVSPGHGTLTVENK